jgi:hypothetical protein
VAAQLPRGRASPKRLVAERTVTPIENRASDRFLSPKRIPTMWYLDSGLAELVGFAYRLCTVIWGN